MFLLFLFFSLQVVYFLAPSMGKHKAASGQEKKTTQSTAEMPRQRWESVEGQLEGTRERWRGCLRERANGKHGGLFFRGGGFFIHFYDHIDKVSIVTRQHCDPELD